MQELVAQASWEAKAQLLDWPEPESGADQREMMVELGRRAADPAWCSEVVRRWDLPTRPKNLLQLIEDINAFAAKHADFGCDSWSGGIPAIQDLCMSIECLRPIVKRYWPEAVASATPAPPTSEAEG